jgi:hypothetical protein
MAKKLTEMSDEEIEVFIRNKFKDLPEGAYNIGTGNFVCFTGKEGYINFEIAFSKKMRDFCKK